MIEHASNRIDTSSGGMAVIRRLLLAAGWLLVIPSLLTPGFYRGPNAWSTAKTYRVFHSLLGAVLAAIEPHNLTLGWIPAAQFVVGWLLFAGTLMFFLSPLLLVSDWWRRAGIGRCMGFALLSVWLPPLLESLDHRPGRSYLWGYYCVAVGFTLVLGALLLPVPFRRRVGQGFEPVMGTDR